MRNETPSMLARVETLNLFCGTPESFGWTSLTH